MGLVRQNPVPREYALEFSALSTTNEVGYSVDAPIPAANIENYDACTLLLLT